MALATRGQRLSCVRMVRGAAVITGGTRGLGKAIAHALTKASWPVALWYRNDEASAKAAKAELEAAGGRVHIQRADVLDPGAVEAAVAATETSLGPIACLVNNAFRSGRPPAKLHDVGPDDFREDLLTNLHGQFVATRACVPSMQRRNFGRIIFIGSWAMGGEPGRGAYAAAKSGLVGLAKTAAKEYARDGITANVICPGFLDTGAFTRLPEAIQARALERVPTRQVGAARDVGDWVRQLASDAGAYVTGQVIFIDGGASL